MTPLGSVYGGALYALAKDEGLSDRILSEVKVLSSAFSENEGFLRILSAPNLPKEERLSILDKSFSTMPSIPVSAVPSVATSALPPASAPTACASSLPKSAAKTPMR